MDVLDLKIKQTVPSPDQKLITINGKQITLERRTCKCGCRQDFWVDKKSTNIYASRKCQAKLGLLKNKWTNHRRNINETK